MDLLSAFVAVAIAWLPVWLLLGALVPMGLPGRLSIVSGYSLLLGLVLVTVVMRAYSAVGVPFSAPLVGMAMAFVAAAGLFLRARAKAVPVVRMATESPASGWEKLLIAACLILIALRLCGLFIEVATLPLYSWDSKQHWAKVARVLLDQREVVEHVTNGRWLFRWGEDVYTNPRPDYPVTIPLLQAWVGLVMGRWHDVYVNLPWLFCYLGIGLVFYGQSRAAGVRSSVAVVGTYMLLSLPLINSHVTMAGYADLFMAAAYLGTIAAFLQWTSARQHWQGWLLLASLLSCILLKNEGFYWAVSVIPGVMVLVLGVRRGVLLIGGLGLLALIAVWLLPEQTIVAGHTIKNMHFSYAPEAWYPLLEGFFLHDNWHLVLYLTVAVMVAALCFVRAQLAPMAPALVALAAALGLYFTLYLLTGYSDSALNHTSINRTAMHLVPAIGWVTLVLYSTLLQGSKTAPAD